MAEKQQSSFKSDIFLKENPILPIYIIKNLKPTGTGTLLVKKRFMKKLILFYSIVLLYFFRFNPGMACHFPLPKLGSNRPQKVYKGGFGSSLNFPNSFFYQKKEDLRQGLTWRWGSNILTCPFYYYPYSNNTPMFSLCVGSRRPAARPTWLWGSTPTCSSHSSPWCCPQESQVNSEINSQQLNL